MLASDWSRGLSENFQRGYPYDPEPVPIERYWPQSALDWFISDPANRSLPSIEGSGRLAGCWDEPIQCHLRPKTLDWHRIRIVRVPPLKIFLGPLDQWEASILSSRPIRSLGFGQILSVSRIRRLTIWRQCANWLTIEWPWTTNGTPLTNNKMPIDYQWYFNWLQLNANWLPMECQWTSN